MKRHCECGRPIIIKAKGRDGLIGDKQHDLCRQCYRDQREAERQRVKAADPQGLRA